MRTKMRIEAECKLKGECKYCGKWFDLYKPFQNHLAYEHDIYVSKRYKVKAMIRKFINKVRGR